MLDPARLHKDVHWREAYAYIEEAARTECLKLEPLDTLSTVELADYLLPESACRGDDITARKRVLTGLQAMAPNVLADCAYKGQERRQRRTGKMLRPWVWHFPEPKAEAPAPAADSLADKKFIELVLDGVTIRFFGNDHWEVFQDGRGFERVGADGCKHPRILYPFLNAAFCLFAEAR